MSPLFIIILSFPVRMNTVWYSIYIIPLPLPLLLLFLSVNKHCYKYLHNDLISDKLVADLNLFVSSVVKPHSIGRLFATVNVSQF